MAGVSRGYWDALVEQLKKAGIQVYDGRSRYGEDYARSSMSDGTIGFHDSANSNLSAPSNPYINRYDWAVGLDQEGNPYARLSRPIDAQRGSVHNANAFAGPQIAYVGPYGGAPPEQVSGILSQIMEYTKQNSPWGDVAPKFASHSDLYARDKRYSRFGRDDEAPWLSALMGKPTSPGVQVANANVPMARRGITTFAGHKPVAPNDGALRDAGPEGLVLARDVAPQLAPTGSYAAKVANAVNPPAAQGAYAAAPAAASDVPAPPIVPSVLNPGTAVAASGKPPTPPPIKPPPTMPPAPPVSASATPAAGGGFSLASVFGGAPSAPTAAGGFGAGIGAGLSGLAQAFGGGGGQDMAKANAEANAKALAAEDEKQLAELKKILARYGRRYA